LVSAFVFKARSSVGATMLRVTAIARGYHYVHPKNGKPIRQFRRYGDPRYINNEAAIIKGQWGLITSDFGMVTATQMENARLAILRRVPRAAFSLTMHTDYEEFPVVKKPVEARYGGGKNNIHHFGYKFTTGIPLFELEQLGSRRLTQSEAEIIFLLGRAHIPIHTVVVPQGRVDEYSVFK
jgi:ribosomal protein L16/L10AE